MPSSDNLITAIQRGDESTLEKLYEQHRKSFLRWAGRHYPLDSETLLDLYQDSVIVFYQRVAEGKITELSSRPGTYLFGIAKHLILRELKRRDRHPNQLDAVNELSVEPAYLVYTTAEHQRTVLEKSLDQLGFSCRRVLEYFYYHGFSLEVIAERMRYKNADTVKAHKYRCLKQLEQLVKSISKQL